MCLRMRYCCCCCSLEAGVNIIGILEIIELVMNLVVVGFVYDSRRPDTACLIFGNIIFVLVPRCIAYAIMCQ